MRKYVALLCVCLLFLAGCAVNTGRNSEDSASNETENFKVSQKEYSNEILKKESSTDISMQIDDTVLDVEWENNETINEIKEELKQGELTIRLSKYSDFEQVGELSKTYSSFDKRITAEAGDIMLYSGNKIVVFYGENTWEYTRIGKIKNLGEDEIKRLLSNENVELKLK